MPMDIEGYLNRLQAEYGRGVATEHSYRSYLKDLLEGEFSDLAATNEPKRIACGAPDFVITRGGRPIGYIETKDLGEDLDSSRHQEQLARYTGSLSNFIFTNYLEFRVYRDGNQVGDITVGKLDDGRIKPVPGAGASFDGLLHPFAEHKGEPVRSLRELTTQMAAKARLMAKIIYKALLVDTGESQLREQDQSLQDWYQAFREYLLPDLGHEDFADIYAQTVAYGLFAARLYDDSPKQFTRQRAVASIPSAMPLLQRFFTHIAGYELDDRIDWLVDDLVHLFRSADVGGLMRDQGTADQQSDPFIHFYETFLAAYDPDERSRRGVFYTPEPVVQFIVRAVDHTLRKDFSLANGLADDSKIPPGEASASKDTTGPSAEMHKVQILDPAAGTGTFLAAIVRHIYQEYFSSQGQAGLWPSYVTEHLIPRLNGFELMMAPYAVAHVKLGTVLQEKGGAIADDTRLRVFLTNTLENLRHEEGLLFAQWLVAEAKDADSVKHDTPVMVVIGNPPYRGESVNNGRWITQLLADKGYKSEPGGGKLREKNIKWLNDDYVKFICYGQSCIEDNGEGILAFVNNHSYLDNPTFRGMRHSLLKSFDHIYIIDLHGNANKKEASPDGSPDENVFAIRQGVAINLFVKTGKKQQGELAKISHYDLQGKYEGKCEFLWQKALEEVPFEPVVPKAPSYRFKPGPSGPGPDEYERGFRIDQLFPINSVGIVTARDEFTVHQTPQQLADTVKEFRQLSDRAARKRFALGADSRDWKVAFARKDLEERVFAAGRQEDVDRIAYRPFDTRFTYYTGKSRGFHCMPRHSVMQHLVREDNTALALCRQVKGSAEYCHAFVVSGILDHSLVSNRSGGIAYALPLYRYPSAKGSGLDIGREGMPNLDEDMVGEIASKLGMRYTPEGAPDDNAFAPIDLLDYIYAVLYSPAYRSRYRQQLCSDFPRVPYPKDKSVFRQLVGLGGQLRTLHLLESSVLDSPITTYPEGGDNLVATAKYEMTDTASNLGRVWINSTQYVGKVPETAWNAHIGAYQPAQKWLSDRDGQELTTNDIKHYQKVITALAKTHEIAQQIGEVLRLPNDRVGDESEA